MDYRFIGSLQDVNPKRILLVGCGGTGSFLVSFLARFMATQGGIELMLMDGDRVEKKNLIRQNFKESDISRNKAEVLAVRYGRAFGVSIGYTAGNFTKSNGTSAYHLVLSCVDKNTARVNIHDALQGNSLIPWLDAGNELINGQVVLSNLQAVNYDAAKNKLVAGSGFKVDLFELHPELKDTSLEDPLSCADRLWSGEQTFTINLTSAIMMMNMATALLLNKELPYYEVQFTNLNSTKKLMLNEYGITCQQNQVAYEKILAIKAKEDETKAKLAAERKAKIEAAAVAKAAIAAAKKQIKEHQASLQAVQADLDIELSPEEQERMLAVDDNREVV